LGLNIPSGNATIRDSSETPNLSYSVRLAVFSWVDQVAWGGISGGISDGVAGVLLALAAQFKPFAFK
jgi:hypothetical protein